MHPAIRRTLAALLLLLALATPTLAATTYYVSPTGNDGNPGTSSAPFLTIQQGLNSASDGDTVTLNDGTYTGPGDVDLDFAGYNIILNSVHGASKTIIDCGGTSSSQHRGFYFHSGETTASVNGVTIKNGYESYGMGSAVDIESGSAVMLNNCTLTGNSNNTTNYHGGSVYNSGTMTLTGCTFIQNATSTGLGGGVANIGAATIKGCAFLANNSTYFYGSALYNSSAFALTVTNCVFSGNPDYAVYNGSNVTSSNPLTLRFCTFTVNTDGALLNYGAATVIDSILYGDTGSSEITNSGSGTTTVTYTDIQGGLRGTGNLSADPQFVRPPDLSATPPDYGDLHLKVGSSFIAKGIAISGVTTDFDGNVRANPPDLGAYERVNAAPPATLSSVTLTPTSVTGGTASQGKVTLSAAAPAGGATVALKSSDTTIATVPASVTIAAGNKSISFTVTSKSVTTTKTVTVTATIGSSTKTATLTVTPPPVTVSALSVSPTSVVGGAATSTGTVTLTGPAPTGGLSVTLKSSDTAAATVAATLNIAAGTASATFTITTYAVTVPTSVTLTATVGSTSKTATLTVNAPPLTVKSLALSPSTVTGGQATTGTITLTGNAPSGGAAVAVTFSGGGGGTVPVAAGSSTATFTILTFKVTAKQTVTVSAAYGGTTKTATLTVNPSSGSARTPAPRLGGPVFLLPRP